MQAISEIAGQRSAVHGGGKGPRGRPAAAERALRGDRPLVADHGRRYRAYPTSEQAARLTDWAHSCRAVWNMALGQREWLWQQRRVSMNAYGQSAELTLARRELEWLADLPAKSADQVLRHLDQAYRNWWNPNHPAGAPTRHKRGSRMSIPFAGQQVRVRRLNKRWGAVRLSKIGEMRFRWTRDLGGMLRNATVSHDGLGWHVAFGVATGRVDKTDHDWPGTIVGLDRGVTVAVADSDGGLHDQKFITERERAREVALERRASRQELARRKAGAKTSNRARGTRVQLGRIKARTVRRRGEFSVQLAHVLADRYESIAIEKLNVAGMTRSASGTVETPGINVSQKRGLNRAILDKGWYGFEQALRLQAKRTGSQIIAASAAYSSQTCAACGYVASASRKSQAVFRCVSCGHEAHADINAAIVVRQRAVNQPPDGRGSDCVSPRKWPRQPLGVPHEHYRESLP